MLCELLHGLETRPSPQNVRRKTPLPHASSRADRPHPPDPRPALHGRVAFLPLPVLPRLSFRPYRRPDPPALQSRVCGNALNRTSHDFSGLPAVAPFITALFWGEHAIGWLIPSGFGAQSRLLQFPLAAHETSPPNPNPKSDSPSTTSPCDIATGGSLCAHT
jgi:hypothetical protein